MVLMDVTTIGEQEVEGQLQGREHQKCKVTKSLVDAGGAEDAVVELAVPVQWDVGEMLVVEGEASVWYVAEK
jgi:hypothetical protein